MAAAIPAAIGVGSSLIGGISGKGVKNQQKKLLQAQAEAARFGLDQAKSLTPQAVAMLQEIFGLSRTAADTGFTDYRALLNEALGTSRGLYGRGTALLDEANPLLKGAATGLKDLREFYRPFMFEGQSAIDRFLPSKRRTEEMLAPEFGELSRGFQSASENIDRFSPRGPRASALAKGRLNLASQQADLFFKGREGLRNTSLQSAFQAASGEGSRLGALTQLGLGQGQLGLGTIGAGSQALGVGGGLAMNSFGNALNALGLGRTAGADLSNLSLGMLRGGSGASPVFPTGGSGKGLGGYLVDLFSSNPVQGALDKVLKGIFGGGKDTYGLDDIGDPG